MLCSYCYNRDYLKKWTKMNKKEMDKMHLEILRLREYEEAYHTLFEFYHHNLTLSQKIEISNNLNTIFKLNDWEKIGIK